MEGLVVEEVTLSTLKIRRSLAAVEVAQVLDISGPLLVAAIILAAEGLLFRMEELEGEGEQEEAAGPEALTEPKQKVSVFAPNVIMRSQSLTSQDVAVPRSDLVPDWPQHKNTEVLVAEVVVVFCAKKKTFPVVAGVEEVEVAEDNQRVQGRRKAAEGLRSKDLDPVEEEVAVEEVEVAVVEGELDQAMADPP